MIFLVVIVASVAAALALALVREQGRVRELQLEVGALKASLDRLEQRRSALGREVTRLTAPQRELDEARANALAARGRS